MSYADPRHDEPATRAGAQGVFTPRLTGRLLLTSIAVVLLFGGLSGVGGTYAMWRDQAEADAGTVSTGAASLTASWAADNGNAAWQNLLPGEAVKQNLTLKNTGDVPMELTATLATFGEGFEVRASAGPCPDNPLPTAALRTDAQPLASAQKLTTATVLNAGDTLDVCAEVTATDALAPGDHINFDLRFDGSQTR